MEPEPQRSPAAAVADRAPVLDYARAARRDRLKWLRRPLNPELGLAIWTAGSVAFAHAERRELGCYHFFIGLGFYAMTRVKRWRAHALWKLQVVLALFLLGIGGDAFLEPWAMWNWSMNYWLTYNQTYLWNRDASLRVAWIPAVCLAWLVTAVVAGSWDQRRHERRAMKSKCRD
jgi:hypothetical protein